MKRLDIALVDRGICASREKAQRAIMAGVVRVNGRTASKSSDRVRELDEVAVTTVEKFVSRGGIKLAHAISYFNVEPTGMRVIDLGASTGGFTDCLLQHGAIQVYAVDVGRGQLVWKLRQDKRVIVMEKTNARFLSTSHFPQPFRPVDLATIDCSFISLQKILPPVTALLAKAGKIIALIKPQFEAGKAETDRGGGVIFDPAIHHRILNELEEFVRDELGLNWKGTTESPILGPAGNKEFLVLIEKIR